MVEVDDLEAYFWWKEFLEMWRQIGLSEECWAVNYAPFLPKR